MRIIIGPTTMDDMIKTLRARYKNESSERVFADILANILTVVASDQEKLQSLLVVGLRKFRDEIIDEVRDALKMEITMDIMTAIADSKVSNEVSNCNDNKVSDDGGLDTNYGIITGASSSISNIVIDWGDCT